MAPAGRLAVAILIAAAIVGFAATAMACAATALVSIVVLAAALIPDGVRHDIERLDWCVWIVARDYQLRRYRAFLGRL